jgi:transcriptional regulator with PAS, ATPase and Fis domain
VRVIAATNRGLTDLTEGGRFRKDLYYRLNVVHVDVPPLRERKSDIPILVNHFIEKINGENGYRFKGVTKEAARILMEYAWPGNVRELENAIESAMALSEGPMVESKFLPAFLLLTPSSEGDFYHLPTGMTLDEISDEVIRLTLERTDGNKTMAAKRLGIGLRTLQRKSKGF